MRNTAVIIGAGPGGAAAAVRLAQRGVKDVVLLDKDRFPREKTCGSALSPNGLKIADELGIGAEVKRLGYPIHSLQGGHAGQPRDAAHHRARARRSCSCASTSTTCSSSRRSALGVEFRGGFRASELVREGAGASSACAARTRRSSPTTSSSPTARTRSSRRTRAPSAPSRR